MSDIDKAYETQLKNIQAKTGKTLAELAAIVKGSGLGKHGDIRGMLQRELGLGYGDANTLAHHVLKPGGEPSAGDVVAEIYSGAKAPLRPIHEAFMREVRGFGEFEIAPKKGYLSLRRKKQFAMIGPATNTRVEVGLNVNGLGASTRLGVMPPKSMCDYKVKLTLAAEVDKELMGWVRRAFEAAG